jgi:hypothetical protein
VAKLATFVTAVISCRLLVADGAALGASTGTTLSLSSRLGLGASARLAWLAAFVAPCRGGLPFFLSPWQASHCSRVRCSFPSIMIGLVRACGSSPSTTLRRPIASSIVIVERSSRYSIERAICLYFSRMQQKSFSTALYSS